MDAKNIHIEGPVPYGDPKDFAKAVGSMGEAEGSVHLDRLVAASADIPEATRKTYDYIRKQVDTFSSGVATLKSPQVCPLPSIRELMNDVWNICNHGIVPAGMLPNNPVGSLSFVLKIVKDKPMAMLLIPENYASQFQSNPMYVLGGIVYNGSHIRDFFNSKFLPGGDSKSIGTRARMYEAEFLLFAKTTGASLNKYQKQVCEEFPKGIATMPELLYTPQPTPTAIDRTSPGFPPQA